MRPRGWKPTNESILETVLYKNALGKRRFSAQTPISSQMRLTGWRITNEEIFEIDIFQAGRFPNFDRAVHDWRGRSGVRPWKNWSSGMKSILGKRWVPIVIVLISLVSFLHRLTSPPRFHLSQNEEHKFWSTAPSLGWRSSCAQRSSDWLPPRKSNGYLLVRCNGGLSQQRIAMCNAVLAARIMNATLVLPQVDNPLWHDESGFLGIYDVDHFITTLKSDVRVVRSLPTMWGQGENRHRLNPFQLRPPPNASVEWYETTALEKLKEHGAIYLSPFSHHLAAELENEEYQRLRCRVNYHALRFTDDLKNLSSLMLDRLRSEGPYMSIHLHFQMGKVADAGCATISNFTEEEVPEDNVQTENFAGNDLESSQRQFTGACPLTPEEVGLFLRALGFDNSTRIYLAGETDIGGENALDPLRAIFPLLETRLTVAMPEELALVNTEGRGVLGPAIDYIVCLLSEIFVPTYDSPSEFAKNLIAQRLYYGFRTTLQPDRKLLAPLLTDFENGILTISDFEASVRKVMRGKSSGGPHSRVPPESFYVNPWPECFCTKSPTDGANYCPSKATTLNSSYDEDQDGDLAGWNI